MNDTTYKMRNRLYHRKVFWPKWAAVHTGQLHTQLTNHARQAEKNDRYGVFSIPSIIDVKPEHILEIEVDDYNDVIKQVVRLPLNEVFDVVLAFIPENGKAVIKTAWLNKRSDKHSTLRRELYQTY